MPRAAPFSPGRNGQAELKLHFDDEASIEQSEFQLTEAVKLDPDNVEANLILGLICNHRNDYDAAYPYLKKSVSLDPGNVRGWRGFAVCLYNLNHFEAAVIAYTKASALDPSDPDTLLRMARAFSACGRSAEAMETINKALELAPDYAQAHTYAAQQFRVCGDFQQAREAYYRAIELGPTLTGAYYELSTLDNDPDQARDILERIAPFASASNLTPDQRSAIYFAQGILLSKLKDYDASFAAYANGNAELKASTSAHWDQFQSHVSDTIEGFQPGVFEQLKDAAHDDAAPVFIVGMPRSGTTLVEQIMSSHHEVHAGGEIPRLQKIASALLGTRAGSISYPRNAGAFKPEAYSSLAQDYLAHLRMAAPEARGKITDKLPFNYLNLGLIAVMFPNATIIHCRRDPMDTCLSCFFQKFDSIGNIWFANDLEDLGRYYRSYERLMNHWRNVLPLPILDVQYEDLIADQEGVSRKIIAHAGLDWDDACLEFHKNERAVGTASVWQVRQPVYKTSVQRWKRYEKHLQPLKKALAGDTEQNQQ